MSAKPRPNFFIVGAPKAGTTTLHGWLQAHPQVFLPDLKEPDFFTWREIEAQNLYYGATNTVKTEADYLALFSGAGQANAIGEASVSYLWYPQTAEKIRAFNPQARILILLRHPSARAISHYKMDERLGFVSTSLEDIFYQRTGHAQQANYFQQYIELGNYSQQIERYFNAFGRENVLVMLPDGGLETELARILHFLGVAEMPELGQQEKRNEGGAPTSSIVRKLYKSAPVRQAVSALVPGAAKRAIRGKLFSREAEATVSPALKAALDTYYAPELERLSQLLNQPCWPKQ